MSSADRLIVALDVESSDRARELVDQLSPHVSWFKLGSVLFTREGPEICRIVKSAGARLFLDLKFHDIPNTVYGAVTSAMGLDIDMLTIHTSGGQAMMEAAVRAREECGRSDVMIIGVTVLTHLALEDFRQLFASDRAPEDTVLALTRTAQDAGLDGVVASAKELTLIKRFAGPDFKVVTPGIRLADGSTDDQARVVTPGRAIRDGADYLVVGRPVIAADDPVDACQKILADMTG
ncbi:MAG: orotidine-5'-phosphate decarboxylase [bacterium]|nr:orotidine-5'-phosphate decarboxylase [bacterium]